MALPVFIHHETGEKKQRGGESNQKYLYYAIKQAEKMNNEVFLFGDSYNSSWCDNFQDVSNFSSEEWVEFLKFFKNQSTYPIAWAKGFFKRFYIIAEYLKMHTEIDNFVLLDSDVLIYLDFKKMKDLQEYDVALIIPENQDLPVENGKDMRMVANCGVSYWSRDSLFEFIEFCTKTYMESKLLDERWEIFKKNGLPGGNCEMTLLYLWIKEKNKKVKNLSIVEDGKVFMSNFLTGENYYSNEFTVNKFLGYKKLDFINGEPYIEELSGNRVMCYNIHFGGDSKRLMKDYFEMQTVSSKTMCIEFFFGLRNVIAKSIKRILNWKRFK